MNYHQVHEHFWINHHHKEVVNHVAQGKPLKLYERWNKQIHVWASAGKLHDLTHGKTAESVDDEPVNTSLVPSKLKESKSFVWIAKGYSSSSALVQATPDTAAWIEATTRLILQKYKQLNVNSRDTFSLPSITYQSPRCFAWIIGNHLTTGRKDRWIPTHMH